MPDDPTASPRGADLARQALNVARAEARRRGSAAAPKPKRRHRAAAGSGRDPLPVKNVIDQLADEFGWKRPSAGAQIVIRWAELVPDLARLAAPERYDAETRTLHLRPVSPAAATQLRLTAGRIPAVLAERTGADTVTAVNVLPPGRTREAAPTTPIPPPAVTPPARTRDDASAGLRQALDVATAARHRGPAPDPRQDLRDRYFADVRGTLREPDAAFTDAATLHDELTTAADEPDVRAQALARARAEKAGRAPTVPRLFDRTA